jgi:hypothetical protein
MMMLRRIAALALLTMALFTEGTSLRITLSVNRNGEELDGRLVAAGEVWAEASSASAVSIKDAARASKVLALSGVGQSNGRHSPVHDRARLHVPGGGSSAQGKGRTIPDS